MTGALVAVSRLQIVEQHAGRAGDLSLSAGITGTADSEGMQVLTGDQAWRLETGAVDESPIWVYALAEQRLRPCVAHSLFQVPASSVLVSSRPPSDWLREEPRSGDLVMRVDAKRWQTLSATASALPDPGITLGEGPSHVIRHLLEAFLYADLHAAGSPLVWHEHLQLTIVSFLVTHCRATGDCLTSRDLHLHARDQRRLARLMGYMRSRLGAPLSSEDLARAAGLSVRALHSLCQRNHRSTPMEILRNLRLDAVQLKLSSEPDTPVGDIALTLGFGHLGRFSAYYRARFGELPTETRARILRVRGDVALRVREAHGDDDDTD